MERPVPSQAEGGRSPPAGLPALPAPLSAVLPPPPAGLYGAPPASSPSPSSFQEGPGRPGSPGGQQGGTARRVLVPRWRGAWAPGMGAIRRLAGGPAGGQRTGGL